MTSHWLQKNLKSYSVPETWVLPSFYVLASRNFKGEPLSTQKQVFYVQFSRLSLAKTRWMFTVSYINNIGRIDNTDFWQSWKNILAFLNLLFYFLLSKIRNKWENLKKYMPIWILLKDLDLWSNANTHRGNLRILKGTSPFIRHTFWPLQDQTFFLPTLRCW